MEDTDAGGIVYYVNYLKFMERARTELLRSLGAEFDGLHQNELQFVVHSLEAQYKKPARVDDELTVTALVEKLGRTYLLFKQQVVMQQVASQSGITQADVMCEARVKVACVNSKSIKPTAIPEALRQQFLAVSIAAKQTT